MNSSTGNSSISRIKVLQQAFAVSKWLQTLELVIVFSPVLLVIIGFRMFNLTEPMLFIAGVWAGYLVMLTLIWVSNYLRGETWQSIGLRFGRPTIDDLLWTVLKSLGILVFAVAGFVLGSIIMANIVGIPEPADMTKYNYLRGNLPLLLVSLAGVYFVSSFGEEVVFRGFLITRLESLFGGKSRAATAGALVVSSLVFGLAHFEWGAMGIVQTACMGLALGVSFILTKRSLWPLVLAHVYLDTILLVQLYAA